MVTSVLVDVVESTIWGGWVAGWVSWNMEWSWHPAHVTIWARWPHSYVLFYVQTYLVRITVSVCFFFFVCSCFLIKKHVWSVYYSLRSRRIGRLCFRVGKTFLIFSSRSIFSRKFKKKYIKKYQLRIIDDPSEIQVHDII